MFDAYSQKVSVDRYEAIGHACEGAGCNTRIDPGLVLRFCPECRPLQPIPRKDKKRSRRKHRL